MSTPSIAFRKSLWRDETVTRVLAEHVKKTKEERWYRRPDLNRHAIASIGF